MRIQHNIMAMNAYRNFSNNTSALSKNLEKLSSGYKINRAGDDAAGLAISEKMRAQITGLETAQKNAKDGISLIQTAEGALTEVHDMLNRMVELADQSANGTYDNETDRANLQKEFDALRTEIDRIADSSNFNGIKLLDGSLAGEVSAVAAAANPDAPKAVVAAGDLVTTNNAAVKDKFVTGSVTATGSTGKFTVEYMDADGGTHKVELAIKSSAAASDIAAAINADETLSKLFTAKDNGTKVEIEAKTAGKNAPKVTGMTDGVGGGFTLGTANSTDQVEGADRSMTLTVGGVTSAGGTNLKAGTTVTIGDKTYEFVSNPSDVKEGHVAVMVGSQDSNSLANLVEALKQNGVTSASLVKGAGLDEAATATDALAIKIGDLSEISVAQQGNITMDSTSQGVNIKNTLDTAGVYQITAQAAGGTTTMKLELEYLDEAGEKKTISIDYTPTATASTDVAAAIEKAIKEDETLSGLFDVKDEGSGVISLTAKTAGTGGARIIGAKNNEADQASNGIDGGVNITTEAKDAGVQLTIEKADLKAGDTVTIDGKTYEFVKDPAKVKEGNVAIIMDDTDEKVTAQNLAAALKSNGVDARYDSATGSISIKNDTASATVQGKGLTLQIGDTSEDFNQMNVSIDDMHAAALGLADLSIADQDSASDAVEAIKKAINSVSSTRGDLGAFQNRLEHTINNLAVMQENIQDAEATIRDTDVAAEMMEYTKNNILIQSAQAMLAQANQVPQGVLQLLQ